MIALVRFVRKHPVLVITVAAAVAGWLWLSRPFADDDPALAWWQQQAQEDGGDQAEAGA